MLSVKQKQAAALAARGTSVSETAARVGVSEKRMRQWLRNGDFLQEMQREWRLIQSMLYARALRKLGEQLLSDKETVLQHAVHEVLSQFSEVTAQDGEQVVRLESNLALGLPTEEENPEEE